MNQEHTVWALGLAVGLLVGTTGAGSAQMAVPTGRDTLRGLPGVEVIVEDLQLDLERLGLSGAAIHAEVTERLRSSGIAVYDSQTDNPSPAKAYLYIHLNALELTRPETYAVALQVHVRQTVRSLSSDSLIVNAMTWDVHNVVDVPANALESVHTEIRHYVDLFIDDWAAVH